MGIWFGMPCGTISSARRHIEKGPRPLRSLQHVHGFPNLAGRDKLRVDLANEIIDFMYEL